MNYNTEYNFEYFKRSADYVKSKINFTPEIGIILGTGLGSLADEIENPIVIPYRDIPNFLVSTVDSHAGQLILGKLADKYVACMAGRFHYYEGYAFEQLTAPIRLFKLLGVSKTILTNAAGAVNSDYSPGDVMIIRDHINLSGVCPTRGKNVEEFGPRFFDVSDIYTQSLRETAKSCAANTTIKVHEGVYYYFTGPQFETAAEIRAVRILGADAVGMSTVTEALSAAHCSMPILAFSLITNMATGILNQKLSGEEVSETATSVQEPFKKYIKDVVTNI